jgi:hypothetical protein
MVPNGRNGKQAPNSKPFVTKRPPTESKSPVSRSKYFFVC